MLQETPDEFFVPEDVPKYLAMIEQGVARGQDLLAGRSPWTTQTARRLHGDGTNPVRLYAKGVRAHPQVNDDKNVTADDIAKYNLVLFGDPGSTRWIAKVDGKTPASLDA